MTFVVKGDFFKKYKTGDNVIYNLSVLEKLYEFFDDPHTQNKEILLKPIIITIISIIEAILHDFHARIKFNTNEIVSGLTEDFIHYVRKKEIDDFDKYIRSSERYDLFKLQGTSFYKKLDTLRIIRNRVHIQNKWGYKPVDEHAVFVVSNKGIAEICLEIVVKTMHDKYQRPSKLRDYVGDLTFPWKERLTTYPPIVGSSN